MTLVAKQSKADEDVYWFKTFLKHLLSGKENYRDLVVPTLTEAIHYKKGEVDIYQLDRHEFHVVMFLHYHDAIPNVITDDVLRSLQKQLEVL